MATPQLVIATQPTYTGGFTISLPGIPSIRRVTGYIACSEQIVKIQTVRILQCAGGWPPTAENATKAGGAVTGLREMAINVNGGRLSSVMVGEACERSAGVVSAAKSYRLLPNCNR